MKIADDLKRELDRIAPDWEWACQETTDTAADLISPRTLQVAGTNRSTAVQTIPVHVSAAPNTQPAQLATFICEVLMLTPHHQRGEPKALVLK